MDDVSQYCHQEAQSSDSQNARSSSKGSHSCGLDMHLLIYGFKEQSECLKLAGNAALDDTVPCRACSGV